MTANGNATPSAEIYDLGAADGEPYGLVVDQSGYLYVSGLDNAVFVFAPGASGFSASEVRIIIGFSKPDGVAIDSRGNLYVADIEADVVDEFAPGAGCLPCVGITVPINTINVAAAGLSQAANLAFDRSGNLYVAGTNSEVVVCAPSATGNATPIHTIAGSNTGLVRPNGLAIDASNNLYVADYGASQVFVFAPGADNSPAPLRSFTTSGSHLFYGVAIDGSGNALVGDLGNRAIYVFPPGASGTVMPIRIISGPSSGLALLAPLSLTIH